MIEFKWIDVCRKPEAIQAVQLKQDITIENKWGIYEGKCGDWIIKECGDYFLFSEEEFRKYFDIISTKNNRVEFVDKECYNINPSYQLYNRYQDEGYTKLHGEKFHRLDDAERRAKELSKDGIYYGMIGIFDRDGILVKSFAAGSGKKCV